MPTKAKNKLRTNKGSLKRFRASGGSGASVTKIRRKSAKRGHNLSKQPNKSLARKIGSKVISDADKQRVKRMLGVA